MTDLEIGDLFINKYISKSYKKDANGKIEELRRYRQLRTMNLQPVQTSIIQMTPIPKNLGYQVIEVSVCCSMMQQECLTRLSLDGIKHHGS